jgi:pimeloyl-ACP methyl ester carboxylesterase
MVEEMNRMPGGIMAATIRGIARAPTRFGRHRRAAIIVCADDPWLDVACLDVAVAELGLGPAQVHHFPSGGHHPHLECRENPEWSARNLDQIVRIVDSMLITAGEVSTTSPGDASTLPASHS